VHLLITAPARVVYCFCGIVHVRAGVEVRSRAVGGGRCRPFPVLTVPLRAGRAAARCGACAVGPGAGEALAVRVVDALMQGGAVGSCE
jgi:hypothetical protein